MTEQEKRNLFPEGVECICTDFPEGCGGKGSVGCHNARQKLIEKQRREKAIEELRPIIKKGSSSCGTCARWLSFENNFFLERLADYFIRKADEVRKEAAKEIFKALDEIIAKSENADDILLYGKNFSKTGIIHRRFYVYKKDIKTLKEKFGVEVEE